LFHILGDPALVAGRCSFDEPAPTENYT